MAQSKAFTDASHALNDLSHALALLEAENDKLRTMTHDMLTAIDYLCQGNECEYCVLACEPFKQCPIDGIRERSRALGIEDNGG